MRVLVYNIAYATGSPTSYSDLFFTAHRNLKKSNPHFKQLKQFIVDEKPDIIGLVEVDIGSYRTSFSCQAERIASKLDYDVHRAVKYKSKLLGKVMPLFRHQGNAVLTKRGFSGEFHFLQRGVKRLVIEVDFENFRFFLVHLALSERVRQLQLKHLSNLIASDKRPVIVAGDFNTFSGEKELNKFARILKLKNANCESQPTFPSWNPRHQIDYILYSPTIKLKNFFIPHIKLSDHLPIIADFEVE